jgi:hypothetical protein
MSSPGIGQGEQVLKIKSASFESAISALGELYEGYGETRVYVKKKPVNNTDRLFYLLCPVLK